MYANFIGLIILGLSFFFVVLAVTLTFFTATRGRQRRDVCANCGNVIEALPKLPTIPIHLRTRQRFCDEARSMSMATWPEKLQTVEDWD